MLLPEKFINTLKGASVFDAHSIFTFNPDTDFLFNIGSMILNQLPVFGTPPKAGKDAERSVIPKTVSTLLTEIV